MLFLTDLSQVGYIPIPRVEYTDDSVDIVIENLTLSGRNLFPNIVSIEAHNYMSFSPYGAIQDGTEDSRSVFIVIPSRFGLIHYVGMRSS